MKQHILVIMAGIITITSCKNQPNQAMKSMSATPIPVIEVGTKNITGHQVFPVNIEGKINNAVRAKISGYIKEVYVDEGQHVNKGQPLFRLETDVLTQNARAASAGIGAADATITAAQAAVNAAQVEVNKLIPLVQKNIISNVQLETAQANLSRALGQLEQAKASKLQAQANLSSIQANIDFAIVRSPVTGVIGSINYKKEASWGHLTQCQSQWCPKQVKFMPIFQ